MARRRKAVFTLLLGVSLPSLAVSAPAPAGAITYDARWGTSTTQSAIDGWNVYALHSGNKRTYVDSVNGNDSNNGSSVALAKATYPAARTAWATGFTSGDQLFVAGGQGQVYTESGTDSLTNKGGISLAYPTVITSYDSTDPTNAAKFGRLTGSKKPIININDGVTFSNLANDANNYYAINGIKFNFSLSTPGAGIAFNFRHDGVSFQNCDFPNVQPSFSPGATDGDTANYGRTYNFSKCSFYGSWATNYNAQGLFEGKTFDFYVEDCVFVSCGHMIGSDRSSPAANGGAGVFGHADYMAATSIGVKLNRCTYVDSAADGLNLRGSGACTSNASLDEPIAGNIGGFSGSFREAPNGVTITVDDWAILGEADTSASQPRDGPIMTTNTLLGSHLNNIAMVDSPKFGLGFGINLVVYNNGNSADISTITNVGTTATLTTVQNHNLITGDLIWLSGATPAAYNVSSVAVTVTGTKTFTYTMLSNPGGSASVGGYYTPQVPQYLTVSNLRAFNYANVNVQQIAQTNTAINNTYTGCITDVILAGVGNQLASAGLFPNYKTRDQIITAVLTGVGITPGANYFVRKCQLINAMLTRPDLPWAQWILGVTFTAMGLVPMYSTPAYQTFTDTPLTVYKTTQDALSLSTLNFQRGVVSTALLSGCIASPKLSSADLPSGFTLQGNLLSYDGTGTGAATPTFHVTETDVTVVVTNSTAFTLNISAAGGGSTSAFDPNAGNTSTNFTLTNSNFTATKNSSTGDDLTITTLGKSSTTGEGYFEAHIDVLGTGGGGHVSIGVGPNGVPADYVHDSGFGYVNDTRIDFQNSALDTGAAWTTGDVIGVYVKNGKIWFHKNGTWQGTGGNPSAAGAGYSLTGIAATIYPSVSSNATLTAVTINTGGSSFVYTIPTSGNAWG